MTEADQLRNEDLRRAVRRICAERPGLALTAASIRRSLAHEFETLTDAEVIAALSFMVSLRHIEQIQNPLGASLHYRITAEGTLGHERGL